MILICKIAFPWVNLRPLAIMRGLFSGTSFVNLPLDYLLVFLLYFCISFHIIIFYISSCLDVPPLCISGVLDKMMFSLETFLECSTYGVIPYIVLSVMHNNKQFSCTIFLCTNHLHYMLYYLPIIDCS